MYAVRVHEPGGPSALRYEEVAMPEPGPGEVRVHIKAAGVNHRDIWTRSGAFHGPEAFPVVLGSDGAGEVDAVGDHVTEVSVGQRVIINPGLSCGRCLACQSGAHNACAAFRIFDGTYAEYAVVPVENVAPMPSVLTFQEAASLGVPFITAEDFLERAEVLPGQTVLVWGATGGLGLATLQLVKLRGARALAVTRSAQKAEALRQLGTDDVVLWDGRSDIQNDLQDLVGEPVVDVVVDSLGQATFPLSLSLARKGGVVVSVGSTTGGTVELELGSLFRRRLTVLGAFMGGRGVLPRLLRLFARGMLIPTVDHTYPLEQADQAHEQMERGDFVGNLVLEP